MQCAGVSLLPYRIMCRRISDTKDINLGFQMELGFHTVYTKMCSLRSFMLGTFYMYAFPEKINPNSIKVNWKSVEIK